jgi:hypothetical protein
LSPLFNLMVALYDDGTISGYLPEDLPLIDLSDAGANHKIVAISGSPADNCEAIDTGTIFCSGGSKTIVSTVAATSVGVERDLAICALYADGSARCSPIANPGGSTFCSPDIAYWCDPNGTVALGQGATAITTGGQSFTCALLTDGGIKCWNYVAGTPSWLGSGVSGTSADVKYGPWNEIDLGSHP